MKHRKNPKGSESRKNIPQDDLPPGGEHLESESPEGESAPQESAPQKPSAWKALLKLIIKLAVVAGIGYLALIYVFGVFRLSGNMMYPMLKDGDLCITYKLEEYHSQDVVAYRMNGVLRFGRIVARGGDTFDGDETGIRLNGGHPLEEIFYPTEVLDTALDLPVELGEGEYVILNDYREDLTDSRVYGVIDEEALEGKVIFIFRRRGF